MGNFGVQTTFVSLTSLDEWRDAIQSNTKMVFFETPTNPLMEIGDIAAISEIAAISPISINGLVGVSKKTIFVFD